MSIVRGMVEHSHKNSMVESSKDEEKSHERSKDKADERGHGTEDVNAPQKREYGI